ALASAHVVHVTRIDQQYLEAALLQDLVERDPPGRRWRTESPQCWPPSAAQTWCAVSRATLSRRRMLLRCNGRIQFHQLYQPILAVQLALRELLPAAVAPAFVPMRPNPPLDPTVEFVEERSDVGTLVIVSPPPQDWVELLDQILGLERYRALG